MASQLLIDQVGLPAGVAGFARTDGLDTGALVTLTNTGSGSTTLFNLLWVPPGDTTAVATLAATVDPKVWTFTPTVDVYGSYLIELIENGGALIERRTFVIRTPNLGLVIPALNEVGDSNASLLVNGPLQVEAAHNNATDFTDNDLNAVNYAAWWRALHELVLATDAITGEVSNVDLLKKISLRV